MKTKHFIIIPDTLKRYGLTTSLVAILICCYQTGMSKAIHFNNTLRTVVKTTAVNSIDTVRYEKLETSNPIRTNTMTIADTLNFTVEQNANAADSMVSSYLKGMADADSSYVVKKSSRLGTLISTAIFSPVITILPVAIASIISPKKHLHPNIAMLNNAAYMRGYKHQAHCIKRKTLWGNFVGGGTPWCIVVGFLML